MIKNTTLKKVNLRKRMSEKGFLYYWEVYNQIYDKEAMKCFFKENINSVYYSEKNLRRVFIFTKINGITNKITKIYIPCYSYNIAFNNGEVYLKTKEMRYPDYNAHSRAAYRPGCNPIYFSFSLLKKHGVFFRTRNNIKKR